MAKKRPANHRADAEVGYGKPPNASQFKPGQSGNPKGRPKGSLNLATVFARAARETVVINQGGRSRRISKLAAVAIQLTNKAVAGDTAFDAGDASDRNHENQRELDLPRFRGHLKWPIM